ncbi:queuosine precursor transporter [Synechococcus sp. CS-1328]|uniref:queuosine precursor transporter n=1 Tax=Synechococcus sp. CS-1328 TaxID=2847976 RepID=UPI00223C29AC|nr:queuosine precursor transporter [Synechococcus sp. CS-1328]MCT0225771.1 queuosine precursor transporter [Synechococcus sp. CS-1328]
MTLQQRRDLVFLVLAGLFLGTMGMLNILGLTRFLTLGSIGSWPIVVAVGALPYPVTFLCTDLISEIWGEQKASQLVWVGLLLNGWIVLILWLGGVLPGLDGWGGAAGVPGAGSGLAVGAGSTELPVFYEMRRLAFGAVGASMVAYLAAQFTDVRLFHFWKRLSGGRALWLRNNGSTLVSQLVDTTAVVLISHYANHALPVREAEPVLPQLASFIASGYVFKVVAALADTLPFYGLVAVLRRWLEVPGPGAELGEEQFPA